MLKEILICTVIVILIFIGNSVTQGYSENSIEDINKKLTELKNSIDQNTEELEKNREDIVKKEEEIYKEWEDMFSKLAYYIEHEELEKVSRNLENIKTYIKLEQYKNSIKEINEVIFILEHIEDKYSFSLQNIF